MAPKVSLAPIPTFNPFAGLSTRLVLPRPPLYAPLYWTLFNRFEASAEKFKVKCSFIRNVRRRLISILNRPGPRKSPKSWAEPPTQYWSAKYLPFGARIVWPSNAHALYFRKVFRVGVTMRPHGRVTDVTPSYQRCSS